VLWLIWRRVGWRVKGLVAGLRGPKEGNSGGGASAVSAQ